MDEEEYYCMFCGCELSPEWAEFNDLCFHCDSEDDEEDD